MPRRQGSTLDSGGRGKWRTRRRRKSSGRREESKLALERNGR